MPVLDRFLTPEAFCLSQKIIWGTVENWTKEKVPGLQIPTHREANFKLLSSLSADKGLADMNTMFSLWNSVMQQNPDLMQTRTS